MVANQSRQKSAENSNIKSSIFLRIRENFGTASLRRDVEASLVGVPIVLHIG